MVTEFVISEVLQARLRRSVLAAGVEPFVLHLTSHGYAPRTIGVYVDAVAHLARWMRRARASFARLDERLIERFIGQHLPRCRCPEPCCRVTSNVRAAGRLFIKVSRQAGLLRASVHGAPAAPELAAFRDYLSVSQGLAESTQRARLRIIADFFRWRFGRKVPRPAQLTVSDVQRFVTAHCVGAAAGNAAVTACALRSYLRFRALAGQAVAALLAAVPAVAQWPLERLPQVLDDTLIQAIEQTFDVSTAGGARDRAMFRLMLDLGLRVSEVARIKLQDIDWRRGVLHIAAGKSRRMDTLPLGRNVAKAIIQYLRVARPPTTLRTLFVRKTAPVNLPIQLDAVRAAMRQAYRRCGHPELCARTHVLRHTAASRMLRAGAPLKQIADVLRHRSLDTTTIYAKVDAVRLAAVAMAWPGSQL